MKLAEEPRECRSNDSPWLVCVRCRDAGKCLLAEDSPAKQERLTEEEIETIDEDHCLSEALIFVGDDAHSVGMQAVTDFVRDVELACAKKWGVKLG